jgi:hypothetical protein
LDPKVVLEDGAERRAVCISQWRQPFDSKTIRTSQVSEIGSQQLDRSKQVGEDWHRRVPLWGWQEGHVVLRHPPCRDKFQEALSGFLDK